VKCLSHWEKGGGEYIELEASFYDVSTLLRRGIARVSPLVLETAATSVRGAAQNPSPFAFLPPRIPTPVPVPSHVSLQTHRIAIRLSCRLARTRSAYPLLEAAGEARLAIYTHISRRMQNSPIWDIVLAMNSCSHFDVPVRVSPPVRAGGEQRRCRSSSSARGWSPRAIRARSTHYRRASARPTASVTPCTRPPLHFVCCCASHRSTFASRSLHPGGESVLLGRSMATKVEWMAPDARAIARGHAAGAPELKGGMALERRSAVVGHRWPTAAGPDERVPAWQAVVAGLRAWHGRCTAWRRARGRRALRWRRVRRARRVGRCAVHAMYACSQCAVCVSERVCTRSAPVVRASQMCRLNILSNPTLSRLSRPRPTD
jgi:hypothetical protein